MMIINKTKLSSLIFDRTHGAIPKNTILDVINIISIELEQILLENQSISIENFGTISPYIYSSHKSVDFQTGKEFQTKPIKRVRFHTNSNFQSLIDAKRLSLKKS